MSQPVSPILDIAGLCFQYPNGVEALNKVTIQVHPGEAVAIIGENGAGKTTLVKHLNGLLKPTSGKVVVNGYNTREHTAAFLARSVGLAFQNPDDQLFQNQVRKEIELGPRNLGFDEQRLNRQVSWALELVGLSEAIETHPYDLELSGRKLVAIAAILAMDTPIVVLDEPTTGQDQLGIRALERIVGQLRSLGKTVVAISHDMDFVARSFSRIIVMAGGRVLIDDHAAVVFSRPELLAAAGVTPPPLIQLAQRLGWNAMPLNADEFIDTFLAQISAPNGKEMNSRGTGQN